MAELKIESFDPRNDGEVPGLYMRLGVELIALSVEEANDLTEELMGKVREVKQAYLSAFWDDLTRWEECCARGGAGGYGGTQAIGKMLRGIKTFWPQMTESMKDHIRRHFDVNEQYDPPLVNM